MRPHVTTLSDADMRDLAVYFAAQTPTAGNPPTAPAATAGKGRHCFSRAIRRAAFLPAKDATAPMREDPRSAPVNMPLIRRCAGRTRMYLVARLTSFHKHLPHDTTNDFIMGGVAQTLDEESIQAIAAWLSSLTPERSL